MTGGSASPGSSAASASRTGAARLAAVGLLAVHAVLIWLARPAGITTGGDDARYLLLGQALRHLRYTEVWHVGQPIHSLYPPGYPALLGLWDLLAGGSYDAQVVLGVLLSVAALGTAYLIAERHFEPRIALGGLAALAVSPALVLRAGTVASEQPYTLFSLLALLVLLDRKLSRWIVAGGALVVTAALTRTVGATLVAAVVLGLLLERRYRAAAGLALATALTLGVWMLWSALAPDKHVGGSYVADALAAVQQPRTHNPYLLVLVSRALHNVAQYARFVVEDVITLPTVSRAWPINVFWVVAAVAGLVAGLVAAFRRSRLAALYVLVSAGLFLAWPWPVARFLEPVTPLLVPLWLWGLWVMAGRAGVGWQRGVVAVGTALVTVTSAVVSVRAVVRREGCGRSVRPPDANACLWPAQQDFMAAIRWVRDSTPAGTVVLATKEGNFYYYARRQTLDFRAAIDQRPTTFLDYVRARGAAFVVLTTLTIEERRWLAGRLAPNCGALDVAAAVAPDAYVLRVKPPGAPSAPDACAAVSEFQRAVADSAAGQRWR